MRRLVLAGMLALFAADAAAMSLRCNGTIIKQGMAKKQVTEVCGEPHHTRGFVTTVKTKKQDQETYVYLHGEAWVYDFGPSERLKLVIFGNGIVSGVQQGRYPGKIFGKTLDCYVSDWQPGTSVDEIQYLCGEPSEKRVIEKQYVKSYSGEREVVKEEWLYGQDGKAKVYSFQDHRLSGTTTKF